MRGFAIALLALATLPLLAASQTWADVPLVDQKCSTKFKPDTVDTHTRSCALACESSGYGILTADGTFLKFDKAGSRKALDELKASTKKDHLRATVTGERKGDTIRVATIKLD
ncbi:MAG: hypothetical protein IT165_34825 [Bryobacterales bacterium]|nr:hypothetical protein [Bryobacterales bacterium]